MTLYVYLGLVNLSIVQEVYLFFVYKCTYVSWKKYFFLSKILKEFMLLLSPAIYLSAKKMGDFIEPGTPQKYKYQSIKIETLLKKSEMYFSYCIESKDFIYAFSNCSVK